MGRGVCSLPAGRVWILVLAEFSLMADSADPDHLAWSWCGALVRASSASKRSLHALLRARELALRCGAIYRGLRLRAWHIVLDELEPFFAMRGRAHASLGWTLVLLRISTTSKRADGVLRWVRNQALMQAM